LFLGDKFVAESFVLGFECIEALLKDGGICGKGGVSRRGNGNELGKQAADSKFHAMVLHPETGQLEIGRTEGRLEGELEPEQE